MSDPILSDFETVCKALDEITQFIKVGNVTNLSLESLKQLFKKAKYLEDLSRELFVKGASEKFEKNLKSYLANTGKGYNLTLKDFELICDEVMVKIFSSQTETDLACCAFKYYLELNGQGRLENIMLRMSSHRVAFLEISNYVHSRLDLKDVESVLMIEAWTKLLLHHNEGKNKVVSTISDMLKGAQSAACVLRLLLLTGHQPWEPVQSLVLDKVLERLKDHRTDLWCWALEDEKLFLGLFDIIEIRDLFFQYLIQSALEFEPGSYNCSVPSTSKDCGQFCNAERVVNLLLKFEKTRPTMKKFLDEQKMISKRNLQSSIE